MREINYSELPVGELAGSEDVGNEDIEIDVPHSEKGEEQSAKKQCLDTATMQNLVSLVSCDKDVLCLQRSDAQDVLSYGIFIYLLTLLIASYVLVNLTNYTGLVQFKYDTQSLVYLTVIFTVGYRFVSILLGIRAKYSPGIILSIIIVMAVLAYYNSRQLSNVSFDNFRY